MDKLGRAQLQPLFLIAYNIKDPPISKPHFYNVKPAVSEGVSYGFSHLRLLLFNILLHIILLSYILPSIFFTALIVFRFLTIFSFFY